jgi:hypothetical protein
MFACPATLAEEFKTAGLADLVSEVTPQRVRSKLRQVHPPPPPLSLPQIRSRIPPRPLSPHSLCIPSSKPSLELCIVHSHAAGGVVRLHLC